MLIIFNIQYIQFAISTKFDFRVSFTHLVRFKRVDKLFKKNFVKVLELMLIFELF